MSFIDPVNGYTLSDRATKYGVLFIALTFLGVGAIEKRAVVIDDAIAIRPMVYLTLGFDHRLVDGAVADQFMAHVKRQLENFDGAGV